MRPAMKDTTGLVVLEACAGRENARETPERCANARAPDLDEVSSLLFSSAANLSNHDDALSLRVNHKALQAVHEVGAVEGVTANADARGLAEAHGGGLENLRSQPMAVSR